MQSLGPFQPLLPSTFLLPKPPTFSHHLKPILLFPPTEIHLPDYRTPDVKGAQLARESHQLSTNSCGLAGMLPVRDKGLAPTKSVPSLNHTLQPPCSSVYVCVGGGGGKGGKLTLGPSFKNVSMGTWVEHDSGTQPSKCLSPSCSTILAQC